MLFQSNQTQSSATDIHKTFFCTQNRKQKLNVQAKTYTLLNTETYPEKEKTSLANFLSKAFLEALVSTSTTLIWPGLSLTRLLMYVMSVSSVTSTKSFLGGRLYEPITKTDRGEVTDMERNMELHFCGLWILSPIVYELFC